MEKHILELIHFLEKQKEALEAKIAELYQKITGGGNATKSTQSDEQSSDDVVGGRPGDRG